MSQRVTSHDVAREAGVSRTTVSMVLNGSTAVVLADATRKRVMEAADRLGYRPNSAGRMLASGATKTIGLIVSNPELLLMDGFIPPTLYAISQVAARFGYHVLIEGLPESGGAQSYTELVRSRRIDGMVVLNPRTNDPELVELIRRDFPLVLLGTVSEVREHAVNFTAGKALQQAVGHLVKMGHRNFGYVAFSPPGSIATDSRISLIRHALERNGLALPEACVSYGNFSAESGYNACKPLLEKQPQITAVLAGNDTIALGCTQAARELGRRLPDDLALIGFDDLPFAAFLEPALTTIRTKPVEQGEIAANMLLDMLAGRQPAARKVDLPAEFIVRKSCGFNH
jgi:DNA-binding LacI/PurR family transcriptional regulator